MLVICIRNFVVLLTKVKGLTKNTCPSFDHTDKRTFGVIVVVVVVHLSLCRHSGPRIHNQLKAAQLLCQFQPRKTLAGWRINNCQWNVLGSFREICYLMLNLRCR